MCINIIIIIINQIKSVFDISAAKKKKKKKKKEKKPSRFFFPTQSKDIRNMPSLYNQP